jgi:5-methylcytosine-specific restriction endonuclease McrA
MSTASADRCAQPLCRLTATRQGRCDGHRPTSWAGRAGQAERYGIGANLWRALRRLVAERDDERCYVCGEPPSGGQALHLDHITPVAEGGAIADPDNLVLIHAAPCHAERARRRVVVRHGTAGGRGS